MASIDERIVSMTFENAKFEAAVKTTMGTLGKLQSSLSNLGKTSGLSNIEAQASKVTLSGPQKALDNLRSKLGFPNAAAGFAEIENASNKTQLTGANTALDKLKAKLGFPTAPAAFTELENASSKVTFAPLSTAIDNIGLKFGALQTAATVAFGTVVSKATGAGLQMAKSVGLGPISQGFEEYSTNLNSIQTILANTKFQGSDLNDVNGALSELNKYSDQTIYNFGEMARNIGTFTAAGVDLDTSVGSIKGIANLAALSGSNSQQASTAMYQLSQAIASGKVGLQDWNSVVNAGMGGATFQRALATTANNMGKIKKGALDIDKTTGKATINGESFRESIMAKPGEKPWLTSEVLTKTLEQFTGDMSDAELAAQGFDAAQIKSIQETAQVAKHAATEVKTLKQSFDVVKESIGSGWAATFQNIFGDFEESKKTFTDFTAAITDFVGANADARNKVLADWRKLGGRADLIEGIKNIFEGIGSVLKPFRQAFRDIFPAKTGKDLADLTKRFKDFTAGLKVSPETADLLRRTFKGFFAVLNIGWTIVKKVAGVIGDLFGAAGDNSNTFLNITASIGDFLVALDDAISKGDALGGVFDGITEILKVPFSLLKNIGKAIANLFTGADPAKGEGIADSMGKVGEKFKPIAKILDAVSGAWDNFKQKFQGIVDFFQPVVDKLGDIVGSFGDFLTKAFEGQDFDTLFAAIQTTLIGGIFLAIKKGLGGGVGIDFGGGMLANLGDTFKALTGNLEAMQQNIKANTILQIAIAIGVLAASVAILSLIDPDKIAKAMTAIAVGLAQLVAAMAILTKGAGGAAFVKLPFIAASMILLAISLVILAGAVKLFSTMSWEEIGKGLLGVAGSLTAIALGMKLMGPQLLYAPALLLMAIALNGIAVAVKIFSSMSWEEMAKGLLGVAGALAAIGLGLVLVGPSIAVVGPGLVLAAIGLILLSGAVSSFGNMDFAKMYQGILGVASALVAIGLAMQVMPLTLPLTAAGLVILAVALGGIAAVIGALGNMDVGTLVKGIAAIAGVLVVLAVGLTAMSGTLLGSVALLAAAAAFAVLAPAIALMGNLRWSTILKGLAAMALTLGVLAVIGLVAAAPLAALGGALAVLGLGLMVIAGAVYLASKGIALLGDTGPKAVASIVIALTAFVAIFPKIVLDFLKGLVAIVEGVVKLVPPIMLALGTIIDAILAKLIEAAPKAALAITALVTAILQVINDNAVPIINAGIKLIGSLLSGLATGLPKLIPMAVRVIVNFVNGVASAIPRLVDAGINLARRFINAISGKLDQLVDAGFKAVINFLHGIATAIRENDTELIDAGADIMDAIIDGVVQAAGRLAGPLKKAIEHLFGMLPGWAKKVLGIHSPSTVFAEIGGFMMEGLVVGLDSRGPVNAMANTAKSVVDEAKKGFGEVPDILGDIVPTDPVITPVLDLSNVDKEAKKLDDMTNVVPITAAASFDQASAISSEQAAAALAAARSADEAQAVASLQFTQNNYSPESLSDAEIYRQTHNQLSVAKSAVGLP